MSDTMQPGRIVKDASTLTEFFRASFRTDLRRRILMVVGNRLAGDSRVFKTATSLADRGFEIVLVGARPLTDDFMVGHMEGHPYLIVNSEELSTGADADGHDVAMKAIGARLVRGLSDAEFGVVYSHDFWGLELGFSVMQGLGYRLPLHWVHDVHEYVRGYEGILPAGRLAYAIRAEECRIQLPDQLVFVNERIAELVCRDAAIDPMGNLVVHNAPRAQRASPFDLRRQVGIGPEVPLGVYLGRATKARGLHVLIEALRRRPDVHFALLSSAATAYLQELRDAAANIGAADRLHIFPYVPDVEVASAASSATFGVSPLTRYGNADLAVPTKVLEFVHAGLPMVVSDATFQADFVRQHGLGQVYAAESASEFCLAVDRLLASPPSPDWMTLRRDYSWDRQFGGVLAHLEQFAAGAPVPSRGVFQGPGPSAGQPGILAAALRAGGTPAMAISLSLSQGLSFRSDGRWPASSIVEQSSLAMWAARRFDVLHLHFRPIVSARDDDRYFSPSFADIGLAHEAGRIVVFHFRGSEIRINSEFARANPFAWMEADDPSGMSDDLKRELRRAVREQADCILVPDPELRTYVPEAIIVPRAVDLSRLKFAGPKRRTRPRIAHAPTRRGAKGTDTVLATAERLKAQGLEFDLVLMEGLPHDKLMEELVDCDVIVDQLLIGWYGVLSVEGMALGKAVVAYIRDDLVDELPEEGVLVNANPLTLESKLRELILDADLREGLGVRARAFVERYHDSAVVARQLRDLYDSLAVDRRREPSWARLHAQVDAARQVESLTTRLVAAKKQAAAGADKRPAKAPAEAPGPSPAPPAPRVPKPSAATRTFLQRLAHASPAKVVNRVKRMIAGEAGWR